MSYRVTAAAAAILAATCIPVAASAQMERSSPVDRYHLMQVAVSAEDVSPEEFKEKTEALRSCEDARTLIKELSADWRRNRFARASALPEQIQADLKELPAGHATPVYFDDTNTMRVLVLCNRG